MIKEERNTSGRLSERHSDFRSRGSALIDIVNGCHVWLHVINPSLIIPTKSTTAIMSLPGAPSAARTHESPSNSSTLAAPNAETSSVDPSSAVKRALESEPDADAGASAGSSAAGTMKSQVEEAAEKVFQEREGKEKEGGGG